MKKGPNVSITIGRTSYKIGGTISKSQLVDLISLLMNTGGKFDASAGFETILFIKGKAYVLVPK